ncbi:cob(I)yrinic acid a,c-diamide adenosyltransferase [Persephonella sp.]
MIIIFTGNGKGKTTAAVGTGIRALGAGKKVLMVQFMKVRERSSEYNVIKDLKGFDIYSFGREGFYLPEEELKRNPDLLKTGVKPFSDIDFKLAEEGISFVRQRASEYDLIILDEICVAVYYRLLDTRKIADLLKEFRDKHFILTGRYCPDEIIDMADLVTQMIEVKHYYKKGVKAVKGLDF